MNVTTIQLERFLRKVDKLFPVPLSQKCDLHSLAEKFNEKATVCAQLHGDDIVALAAGYTDNVVENRGYISVVATLPEAQGNGYASQVILRFLDIAAQKNLKAVHLYADRRNEPALAMYRRLGFVEWKMPDEPRESDVHFIFEFSKEN